MCAMCTYNAYSDNNLLGAYRTMILAGWILAPLRNGDKIIIKLHLKVYAIKSWKNKHGQMFVGMLTELLQAFDFALSLG